MMRRTLIVIVLIVLSLVAYTLAHNEPIEPITAHTQVDYVQEKQMKKYLDKAHANCLKKCPKEIPTCSNACKLLNPETTDKESKGNNTFINEWGFI
jgi:hypothetical protein